MTDLTSELGLAQSTVSKHLACLHDCALVTCGRRAGHRCTRWPSPRCWTCSPRRRRCWPRLGTPLRLPRLRAAR